MAAPEVSARLRYLNESAHLLVASAPATSRYLMLQCNSLMADNDIEQPETRRRKVCNACGTIMVLGWEATIEIESSKARKKPGPRAANRVKTLVYTCGCCNRKTRQTIGAPPPISRHQSRTKQQGAGIQKLAAVPGVKLEQNIDAAPVASAGSKKRAKTRKMGGLGALLASQKAADSRNSGFGLDLMDLMKKA